MSKELLKEKRTLTTSNVKDVLEKNGKEISEKQAAEILDFLYFLAKLTVNQYVKGDSNDVK